VFDLDETLGYFMELGMFWDALKAYIKQKDIKILMNQTLFDKLLDLYPEFLRPNIILILNYIRKKKEKNHCDKLMIYTNNQGPLEWANFIISYFESKINYKIVDQIISAFKVQGKKVELCRTTHLKTHADLIKCTKLPKNTHICFLDDVFYPDMHNDKIYYINIKPYIHDLDFNDMINRLINSDILNTDGFEPTYCRDFLLEYMKSYNYIYVEKKNDSQNIDNILSKKILQHLQIFFKINTVEGKTRKNRIILKNNNIKNKTLKNK
jgi:hypothetical protein